MKRKILFLCTGNYYRSRFAEILFNHSAFENKLDWSADSRGLAKGQNKNAGAISPLTLSALRALGVPVDVPLRFPLTVSENDLRRADLIIALYDLDHRPLVTETIPSWLEHIEFWKVSDIDRTPPHVALAEIEKQINTLVNRLSLVKAFSH